MNPRAPDGRQLFSIVFGAILTASCGASPTAPSPPAPVAQDPTIVCPAPQGGQAGAGQTATIAYPAPVAAGGTSPLSMSCTPPAGSAFPIGDSRVTCTVVDAMQRSASCAFTVRVNPRPPSPRLSVTRIMAFGDSMTEGVDGDTHTLDSPYPMQLQTMVSDRYYDQTFTVFNEGRAGELVSDGFRRMPGRIAADSPQAVLLLEGVNDINFPGGDAGIATMVDTLRNMLKITNAQRIPTFIGTLVPERPGGSKAGNPDGIERANRQIRDIAAREGVTTIDLYQGFGGSPDPYIGADGLHPNRDGYRRMAELFFDAIRGRFEVAPSLPFLTRLR